MEAAAAAVAAARVRIIAVCLRCHEVVSDLLTERQVGVGVQVTGASVVAISVTQLTARCDAPICATERGGNNDLL